MGEVDHDLALLHRGVVFHLPVEHHCAGAVAHGGDDLEGVGDVGWVGGEDLLGDGDLHGVQAPCPHAAEEVGVAELVLAGDDVLDVAEGAVVREDPVRGAGVDHAGHGVVPEVLLVGGAGVRCALDVAVDRVLAHQIAGVAAAHAGGLHAPVGGEVCRPQRKALHAGGGGADLLHVGHTPGRLEDRMHENGLGETGLGFELGEETVHVVDVLGALDLGDHDDVERRAGFEHGGGEIVEAPGRVERVDPGPELRVTEVGGLGDVYQPRASGFLVRRGHPVFEVGQDHVDRGNDVGQLADHLGVRRREEMDHPRRPKRDLPDRIGRPDGERAEEVLRVAHGAILRNRAGSPPMECGAASANWRKPA